MVMRKQQKIRPPTSQKAAASATSQGKSESDSNLQFADNRRRSLAQNILDQQDSRATQLKTIPGVSGFGNFSDLGNGLFGTTQVTNANEVSGLVAEIRKNTEHQNIKVLTGTHGDPAGNLIGEHQFYTEDLAHEGHKVPNGGWINVLDVVGRQKDTIRGWMTPSSSVIILAWCFSAMSVQNWEQVKHARSEADAEAGNLVW